MRLRSILLMVFSSVFLIAMVIIAVIADVSLQKQTTEKIELSLSDRTNELAGDINAWMGGKVETIDTLALMLGNGTEIKDFVTEDFLAQLMMAQTNQGTVADVYVGTADGRMIDGSFATFDSDYDPRERPWYQEAEASDKVVVTKPYVDMVSNQLAVSIGKKIVSSQGEVLGVLAMDILLDTLTNQIISQTIGESGYAFMTDATGMILAHPNPERIDTSLSEIAGMEVAAEQMQTNDVGHVNYTLDGVEKTMFYKSVMSTSWKIAFTINQTEAFKELAIIRIVLIGAIALVTLVVLVITFVASEVVAKPIKLLTKEANIAASGDLSIQIHPSGAKEIRQLGNAFAGMVTNIGNLVGEINQASTSVMDASTQIGETAELTRQVSEEIAKTTNELAQGAQRQAEVTAEGSDMVGQMSDAISRITDYSSHSNEVVQEVNVAVQNGVSALRKQTQLMERNTQSTEKVGKAITLLEEKSHEIEQIVSVIASIADETNLLALNASIEAARAGEHGRGFAVVASEVGKLAVQSSSSSANIETLLVDIRQKTIQSVEEVRTVQAIVEEQKLSLEETRIIYDEIADSVAKIVDRIVHISEETLLLKDKSEEMASSIEDIASVTEESAAATQEVASSTVEQTNSVEHIKAETDKLLLEAKELIRTVSVFKV